MWRFGIEEGSCVYIMRGVGTKYYKIGRTLNIKNRLAGVQSCSPTKIELLIVHYVDDMAHYELSLHDRFQHVRRDKSEWFELSAEDLAFLSLETSELIRNLPLPEKEQTIPSAYSIVAFAPQTLEQEIKPEANIIEEEEPPRLIRVAKDEEIAIADQPTIDDEFQYGLLPEIWELYDKLETWEAVGKHYGIPKGKIWYIANNEAMPLQNNLRLKLGLSSIYSVENYIPEGIQ